MKHGRILLALSVAASALVMQVAKAADTPKVREVAVGISDAFVPGGFSSDSDAYVVTSGVFPNGCYSWKRAEVSHKAANFHEISSYANISDGMCLMVLVPFTKEVGLGKLQTGNHKLRFLNGDGTYFEKTMKVE